MSSSLWPRTERRARNSKQAMIPGHPKRCVLVRGRIILESVRACVRASEMRCCAADSLAGTLRLVLILVRSHIRFLMRILSQT
jgi:hypothetical protein